MHAPPRAVNLCTGRLALVLILIASGAVFAACAGSDSEGPQDQATVTADLFSGRPNPAWMLSTDSTRQLEELLAALATADNEPPAFDQLGFRRFSVLDIRYNGVPSAVSVTPGIVVLDGARTVLSDPDDSVYTFLRSEAEKELSPDELRAIPEPR